MKRRHWLLAMAATLLFWSGPARAQDGFYVIAAGPNAVGTKITSLPYTISNPGFYYLTGNLSYSGSSPGNGITVASDDVTIDLMGFSLSGPGRIFTNVYAIFMSGRKNVEIRNGTMNGWYVGIYENASAALRHRAINMRVDSCSYGIYLLGASHVVKGCTVGNCNVFGIHGGLGSVIGNTVNTTSGTGIHISTTEPNLVTQNTVGGPGIRFSPDSGTVNISNAGF